MAIIRGTTPTITFTFSEILTSDLNKAILTISQLDRIIIERDLTTAVIEENTVSWKLSQEETLLLSVSKGATEIICDWLLNDGTRGRSVIRKEGVEPTGKNEVI